MYFTYPSLFRNIAENKGSMEYNIAFRQLAIKPEDSNSWFIQKSGKYKAFDHVY
jgi:hypothetical protein